MTRAAVPALERTRAESEAGLSRERVLVAALRIIEAAALEALSMRRLGAELNVEAMSLYHYFPSKDALLDGIAERLWAEVEAATPTAADWKAALRSAGHSLRRLAHHHPNAYRLLLSRSALPEPALRLMDALLRTLRAARFSSSRAGRVLASVIAYAAGYAMVELSCGVGRPDVAALRCATPQDGHRFAGVARALGECRPDEQFGFGLEAILAGMERRRRVGRSGR